MKPHFIYTLLFLFFTLVPKLSWACENSEVSLVSFTDNGTSFDYVIEVCIGGGILGGNTGATGPTGTFAIALYTGGASVTVSNFTTSITSDETMVTQNAIVQGPQGAPFNSEALIVYINNTADDFTCITSTALCGQPYSDCNNISFTTNEELEMITVFGLEGNGNPSAGCTGDADMTIDFVSVPVELTRFEASTQDTRVALEWETATETDNDYFAVERSIDGKTFTTVGRVNGNNTSSETIKYQFEDEPQQAGQYYYRLKQVDFTGEFSYSPIVSAVLDFAADKDLHLYPNPTSAQLHVESTIRISASSVTVEIYNRIGQLVDQEAYDWTGQLTLPTNRYQPGMYTLRLYADQQLIGQQRFVKY